MHGRYIEEACVAEPRTLDLEVRGYKPHQCHVVSLDKELFSILSLFTLAPVVQTSDSTIHRINHYLADKY